MVGGARAVKSGDEKPRLEFVLRGAGVVGLSVSVGLVVLFALLDMPDGARAVGLAVFAAVGVASSITIVTDLIRWIIEQRRRPVTSRGSASNGLPDGVERVYPSRADAERDIVQALVEQATLGAGWLITCGVCLRELLHFGRWKDEGVDLFSVMAAKLGGAGNFVEWDIIILDPGSKEARRRAEYEGTGQTLAEIRTSIQNHKDLFAAVGGRIRCWLYRTRPFLFAVLTQDAAFEQRYVGAPPTIPYHGCYGDLGPVFKYSSGSRYYHQLRAELIDFRDKDCQRLV